MLVGEGYGEGDVLRDSFPPGFSHVMEIPHLCIVCAYWSRDIPYVRVSIFFATHGTVGVRFFVFALLS